MQVSFFPEVTAVFSELAPERSAVSQTVKARMFPGALSSRCLALAAGTAAGFLLSVPRGAVTAGSFSCFMPGLTSQGSHLSRWSAFVPVGAESRAVCAGAGRCVFVVQQVRRVPVAQPGAEERGAERDGAQGTW